MKMEKYPMYLLFTITDIISDYFYLIPAVFFLTMQQLITSVLFFLNDRQSLLIIDGIITFWVFL